MAPPKGFIFGKREVAEGLQDSWLRSQEKKRDFLSNPEQLRKPNSRRPFLATPKETIPPRVGKHQPSVGICYILRSLDNAALAPYQWNDENVEIEVRNYLGEPIKRWPDQTRIIPVVQDCFGNFNITWLPPVKFRAPTGGIPARTGDAPGSADCYVIEYDGGQLAANGGVVNVKSWHTLVTASEGERYGLAAINSDGYWFIEADDCSDMTAGANKSPVITDNVPDQQNSVGNSVNLDLSGYFIDPDDDALTHTDQGMSLPPGLMISAAGVVTGTVLAPQDTNYTTTIRATDPGGLFVDNTFDWFIDDQ